MLAAAPVTQRDTQSLRLKNFADLFGVCFRFVVTELPLDHIAGDDC